MSDSRVLTPSASNTGDMSASFNTRGLPVSDRQLSIIAVWTGTPTGTFKLQASSDGTNWYDVPGAAAEFTANGNAQPAGGASNALWNFINVPLSMWRLAYTRSGGSGTLTSSFA